jgi:hypothetical protein
VDVAAAYISQGGTPLLTAAQAAAVCRVQTRTIYQWVRRDRLDVAGLGHNGEQLFDAADLAALCPAA